jgi:hypothetical protein
VWELFGGGVCKSIQDMWFEDDVAKFICRPSTIEFVIVNSGCRCNDASYVITCSELRMWFWWFLCLDMDMHKVI